MYDARCRDYNTDLRHLGGRRGSCEGFQLVIDERDGVTAAR